MPASIEHRARSIACLRWQVLLFSTRFALCALLLIFLPSFSIANEQTVKENKKKQIEQIEIELKREKEKLLKYNVKEKDILEQLSQIEKEISEKRKIIDEIEVTLDIKKKELEAHKKKHDELESSLNHIENLLTERLVAFYKNSKRGYIRVFLATEDIDLLDHFIKYLKIIMDEDRAIMKELAQKKADYQHETAVIEEQHNAVARLEESENDNLTQLKLALEKGVLLLAKIHREKEFYEIAVKELQSAADELKNTISTLENNPKQSNLHLPVDFANSKGKLPLPIKGKILKKVSKKVKRSLGKQKGIYIDGAFGSEVKAVYKGRVEFSGTLKGYGQVIVVNHGERYFTISAYLSERKKFEGDRVQPGDTIGYLGEAGLTTGPALYFEIRKGEEILNPLKWLKD